MNYHKFYTFDEQTNKYITQVPLPLDGWYTMGKTITLGCYVDKKMAREACVKYFNKLRPPNTKPSPTNLGTDVKIAVIYAHELEINALKKELDILNII